MLDLLLCVFLRTAALPQVVGADLTQFAKTRAVLRIYSFLRFPVCES